MKKCISYIRETLFGILLTVHVIPLDLKWIRRFALSLWLSFILKSNYTTFGQVYTHKWHVQSFCRLSAIGWMAVGGHDCHGQNGRQLVPSVGNGSKCARMPGQTPWPSVRPSSRCGDVGRLTDCKLFFFSSKHETQYLWLNSQLIEPSS